MKKNNTLIAMLCASCLVLTGCGAQSTLLIPYDNTSTVKTADIQDIIPANIMPAFSTDLAIIDDDGMHGDMSEPETEFAHKESKSPSEEDEYEDYYEEYYLEDTKLSDTPALLVDVTNDEVIYYNRAFQEVAPASLTKLMTALLVYENANLDDEVVLTAEMNANMISAAQTCGLVAGDRISVSSLLEAMLIYSGNETANALAIHVAGSIADFVPMMNERAMTLGCSNTHFVNTNGLDVDNHYSTCYDLYMMFHELLKYDHFVNSIETRNLTINYVNASGVPVSSDFVTTNYYLNGNAYSPDGVYVYGGKTGTTDNGGACLICYAINKAGNNYIAVSLGNRDKEKLYSQMNKILTKIQN